MSEAYREFQHEASLRPNAATTKQRRVLVPPYASTLALLSSLFFIWGFAQVLNNTLLPHLRAAFDLSYTQATLIGSVWFVAYLTMSLPAAKLIARIGYQRSMVAGLATMALGALG